MAEVTGTIGSEQVELNNAATEETAKKLLASMKVLNQSILKIGGAGGGAGAKGAIADAADEAEEFGEKTSKAGQVVSAFGAAMNFASGVLSALSNTVGVAAGAFVNLSIKAIEGEAKMSDFYGAISQVAGSIPLLGSVLGPVIGFFQQIAAFQERSLVAYQSLSESGINFAGDLTHMRSAALGASMTLSEFNDFVKKNSKTLAMLGGNVNDGAEVFAKMSRTMMTGGVGLHLQALGYTTAQVNDGMASYLEMTGGRNSKEMKNTNAIIESSGHYMEQLDGLARLTGQNREQLDQEMKKKSLNAAWEAKMQGMTQAERDKAMAGLANALATGGEGAADAFQAQVMGLAGPVTKVGQQYAGMFGETTSKLKQSADMVYDSNKSVSDQTNNIISLQDTQLEEGKKYGEQMAFASIAMNNNVGSVLQSTMANNNRVRQQTKEEREAAIAKQKVDASQAAAAAHANQAMKELGSKIMDAVTPLFAKLEGPLAAIVVDFTNWIQTDSFKKIIDQVADFAKGMLEYTKNIFSPEGRDKIVNDMVYYFRLIMIEIKRSIMGSTYSAADAKEDKARLDSEKKIYDDRAATAKLTDKATKEDIAKAQKAKADYDALQAMKKKKEEEEAKHEGTLKGKVVGAGVGATAGGVGGALAGAAAGAALGSVVPIIGTAIGAGIGAWMGGGGGVLLGGWLGESIGNAVTAPGDASKDYQDGFKKPEEKPAAAPAKPGGYHDAFAQPVKKATGSLGTTGKLFENFGSGTPAVLHGTESVVTPSQMSDLVTNAMKTGHDNILAEQLQRLNNVSTEMLKHMKETAEQAKKNVEATKSLNRNVWA